MKIFQTFSRCLMSLISTYIIRPTELTARASVIENGIHETSKDKDIEICGYKHVAYHSPEDTLTLAAIMNAARRKRIMYLVFFMNLFPANQFFTKPDAQEQSQKQDNQLPFLEQSSMTNVFQGMK